MKLIGLSLSACVRDIAERIVPIEAVHHIVSGCSPLNEEEVQNNILAEYLKVPWRGNHETQCLNIFNELRNSNRIMWCAHWEKNPVAGCVHWVVYPDVTPEHDLIDALVLCCVADYKHKERMLV